MNPDDDARKEKDDDNNIIPKKIVFDFLDGGTNYIYEDFKIGLLDIDDNESATVTIHYRDGNGNVQIEEKSLDLNNNIPIGEADPNGIISTNLGNSDQGYSFSDTATRLSTAKGNNSLWEFGFDFSQELDDLISLEKVEVGYTGSGAVAYLDYDRNCQRYLWSEKST